MDQRKRLSRRQLLQMSGTAGISALLAACGAPADQTQSAATSAAPTTAGQSTASAPGQTAAAAPQAGASLAEVLGPDMPGSPNHPKGWTTRLPDLPAGLPQAGADPIVI